MVTKNVIGALLVALLALAAGCGLNNSGCQPAVAASATACGAGVFVDASKSDPICLAPSGLPECRGDDAVCYRCTGASFRDGCIVKNAQQTLECVHSCDKC